MTRVTASGNRLLPALPVPALPVPALPVLALLALGCSSEATPATGSPLTLLYSGNVHGEIEPCG